MVAVDTEDSWMEKCLIAISMIGGSDVQFAGLTETVDFDLGEKDIEGKPLVNGGRVRKWKPEGDSSVTLEAYPLEVGTKSASTTGTGFFDLLHKTTAAVPLRITNNHERVKLRVLVLWTNDPNVSTAQSITADTFSALRIGLADAVCTSVKPSFTDGELKFTIVMKCAAFGKDASSNVLNESCDGSGVTDILPAIASYTTSAKFA